MPGIQFRAGQTLALFVVFFGSGVVAAETDSCSPNADLKSTLAKNHAGVLSVEVGHPTFVSPHFAPIAINGEYVFVANTPADTVDVIDAKTKRLHTRINVGIDPVSIAVRPDGKEVWVSNHVSDSVSVIDTDPVHRTYMQVVATIQEFDLKSRSTRFDEPVGIAFASNDKAYVALSSENEVAVIDVGSRDVKKRLKIPAQDPRAITVRGDRLYVLPFESNNRTQLSGGTGENDGDLVTFNAWEHSIANNNVLSLGAVVDIIKHPKVPDKDLFVYDTETDKLIETVDTLGTLLYGMTVDSKGQVFIAQTDARNHVNGRSGTKNHGLGELGNRAFLNQVTTVSFDDGQAKTPIFFELEPLPPNDPKPDEALATPFAIQICDDDSTLVVSAAGSNKVFTVDADSGEVLGRTDVDAVPRGIALESEEDGKASRAWVLNAVANTVSLVDVSDATQPKVTQTIELDDPTHAVVKRGRIAFNAARASTTGTFSCASCHPDGHTDQLLWVLKTPIVTGGDQIMPRSTMPIRGLRDTAPYHWDGIPGDPYGGNNSANVHGSDDPNSSKDDPASTTRHLIDGGLASTMMRGDDKTMNDEGKAGHLTAAERDDMATFLLSVPYPPAQRRAYTNVVSKRAHEGFELFHIEGDYDGKPTPNVCGNCHRMPFLVSTNTPGTGMDAPTWRGAYDRFLILPQGRLNIIDFDFYAAIAKRGIPERNMWQFSWGSRRRFDPVWDMVLETSTGYSGALGRQVTISPETTADASTLDLLDALEQSAAEGAVVLTGDGTFLEDSKSVSLRFDSDREDGTYVRDDGRGSLTRSELLELAKRGRFIGTFTARHGAMADVDHPQPAIWTLGPIEQQRGRQEFPMLFDDHRTMTLSGRYLQDDALVFVNGRRVEGAVRVDSDDELVEVELAKLPDVGMHLLQLQTPGGLFSNDFIFHVTESREAAAEKKRRNDEAHTNKQVALDIAAARGDIDAARKLLENRADVNGHRPESGSTPLGTAALYGRVDFAKFLIRRGADVNRGNRDGNTPMHVAVFACEREFLELLLEKGGSVEKKNGDGDTPIDSVSAEWSDELAGLYRLVGGLTGIDFDLERMKAERPKIAKFLRTQ